MRFLPPIKSNDICVPYTYFSNPIEMKYKINTNLYHDLWLKSLEPLWRHSQESCMQADVPLGCRTKYWKWQNYLGHSFNKMVWILPENLLCDHFPLFCPSNNLPLVSWISNILMLWKYVSLSRKWRTSQRHPRLIPNKISKKVSWTKCSYFRKPSLPPSSSILPASSLPLHLETSTTKIQVRHILKLKNAYPIQPINI